MKFGIKKILILSASIGAGHTQAANALVTAAKNAYPECTIESADFLTANHSYLNLLLKNTYLKLLEVCPNIYDFLYRWSAQGGHGPKVQHMLAQAMKTAMLSLLKQYQPELIIFTHPFPCAAAAYLKQQGHITLPLAAVITDFAIHPLWVHPEIDFYFVAGQELEDNLLSQNLPATSVFTSGIPISPQFLSNLTQAQARETLQLHSDLPTLLIMGGSLGLGALATIVEELNRLPMTLQLILIAGHNQELARKLTFMAKFSRHQITVLGFTNKVHLLMAAADLIITKPGGLTISESLASRLPMLFYSPLPGQEEENAAYLESKGIALWVKEKAVLAPSVYHLLTGNALNVLKNNTEALRHPNAGECIIKQLMTILAPARKVSGL